MDMVFRHQFEGTGIVGREVKFSDPYKTNRSEGGFPRHFRWSRAKVRGVKTIRYRP